MSGYIWITESMVKVIHDDQIQEHGGTLGIINSGLLSSALARPKHLYTYQNTNLIQLASAYGYGIVQNHPFAHGNKRTAFQVMFVFLRVNGIILDAPEPEVVMIMTDLAEEKMTESQLVKWLETYTFKET